MHDDILTATTDFRGSEGPGGILIFGVHWIVKLDLNLRATSDNANCRPNYLNNYHLDSSMRSIQCTVYFENEDPSLYRNRLFFIYTYKLIFYERKGLMFYSIYVYYISLDEFRKGLISENLIDRFLN